MQKRVKAMAGAVFLGVVTLPAVAAYVAAKVADQLGYQEYTVTTAAIVAVVVTAFVVVPPYLMRDPHEIGYFILKRMKWL